MFETTIKVDSIFLAETKMFHSATTLNVNVWQYPSSLNDS